LLRPIDSTIPFFRETFHHHHKKQVIRSKQTNA